MIETEAGTVGAISVRVTHDRRIARMTVCRLVDQLRFETSRLAHAEGVAADRALRAHIDDAVESVCRNVAEALMCEQGRPFARLVRRARASLTDVQDGLRRSVTRKYVSDRDVSPAREVVSRLYPALSSLLAHCGDAPHLAE